MAEALIALAAGSTEGADGVPSPHVASRVRTVADWASEITKFLERGKSSTIDLAGTVHRARTSLYYGQWAELHRRLPFSKRKAEMLVAIGREFGELDAQTFAHLPGGWSILYQLTKLRLVHLKTLIEKEEVHPALTLAEAKALVARFNGRADAKNHRTNAKLRFRHFQEFVHETSRDWIAADRDFIRDGLCELALELKDLRVPRSSVNLHFPDCTSLAAGSPNN